MQKTIDRYLHLRWMILHNIGSDAKHIRNVKCRQINCSTCLIIVECTVILLQNKEEKESDSHLPSPTLPIPRAMFLPNLHCMQFLHLSNQANCIDCVQFRHRSGQANCTTATFTLQASATVAKLPTPIGAIWTVMFLPDDVNFPVPNCPAYLRQCRIK